ncbi:MAG: serine hydrolase domain-containing protein [Pseudomonadota bacterium]
MRLLPLLLLAACHKDADVKPDTGTGDTSDTQVEDPCRNDTDWEPRFDALAQAVEADLAGSIAAGVSVAVMQDGAIVFAHAFGSGHPEQEVAISPCTLFQIGSDTKKQTAVALLRVVEQGLVSLDDPLSTALPGLEFHNDPSWNDQILVRHLLSHQSGMYDFALWEPGEDDDLLAGFTYGYFAQNWFLMNPPGVFWNYSNPNFSLAGLIAEEHDTRAYPDLMVEDIYRPLGMDRTFLRKEDVLADGDYAVGYGIDPVTYGMGTREMEGVVDNAWTRPAGLAWSTPSQHLLFAEWLMDGDEGVLSDELRGELVAEQINTLYQFDESYYGFGMMVNRGFQVGNGYYQVPVWSHGGNTLAFSSELFILPEQRFAIAITSSGYGTDFANSVATAATTLVEGLPTPVAPPEYTVETERFAYHVGDYYDAWNVGDVIIGQSGDHLTVEMPLLEQYGYTYDQDLVALSSDIHYVRIDGDWYDLTFVQAAEGAPSQYIRNRIYVATRVPEDVPPPAGRHIPTRGDVSRWLAASKVLPPLPLRMARPR